MAEKKSVESYKKGISVEKQKMTEYAEKMKKNVRSLQSDFKKHRKDVKEAAKKLREDGIKKMGAKVGKFKQAIKDKKEEFKQAISRMDHNVKFYQSQINKTKQDFQDYRKAFWGKED